MAEVEIWQTPAFLGLFGDPYLRDTPYAVGGNPQALLGTLDALAFFLSPSTNNEDGGMAAAPAMAFPMTSAQESFVRSTLLPLLAQCRVWTEKGLKVNDAAEFQAFLAEWKVTLAALGVGEVMLVPGGYVGNNASHTIMYIVERTDDGHYNFTVCNKGPGADMYHGSEVRDERAAAVDASAENVSSACEKIRVRPYVQISAIPATRFFDMSFWALLFSLWVRKPPSEYHRAETIYDVLLPWLAGDKLLPLATESFERGAQSSLLTGRTPQRAGLGFCKSVVEAVRWLCISKGEFTEGEVKFSVLYQIRFRLFRRMLRDLEVAKDPAKGVPGNALEQAMHVLAGVSLLDSLQGTHTVQSIAPDTVVGLYFAKVSHPGCHQLTKSLVSLSENLRAQSKHFVVIVVSVDQDQSEFDKWMLAVPSHSWLIVPFPEVNARKQLAGAFAVSQVPTLIIRGIAGQILTPKGEDLVASDPEGLHFPWSGGDFLLPSTKVSYSERQCIEMSIKQIGMKTLKHFHQSTICPRALDDVNELIKRADQLVEALTHDEFAAQDRATFEDSITFSPHRNLELLQVASRDDAYGGNTAQLNEPVLGSFFDVPERVSSIPLAVGAFVRCRTLCESLLRRAADGSSSSRISLHHEVIQLVTSLLIEVLPVPKPESDRATCMWRQPVTREMQMRCLHHIYGMLMVLGSVWQSMEQPSRQFDAERSLAALCALAIYDAVLRTPAQDEPLEISLMMEQEGGYVLAHRFCQANFSLRRITTAMEFSRPNSCITRGLVQAYFQQQDERTKYQLFEYRMPDDKIELKKYSTTLVFFRRLMETYHYQLIDITDPNPPTEMEALMKWFCGDDSQMAQDHPEVPLTRDLVMVVKFLATMETKEVELMRRRTAVSEWQGWQLTFDDNAYTQRRNFFGMRGLERILNGALKWEVSNIRGSDQDVADIDVHGFMERKVFFGEGPVVKSPSELSALLVSDSKSASAARSLPNVVTEDDIMHLDYLPTFDGTLSSEESEYLMSYLTVPYARIPLVVAFFASRDRVTYLFHPALQHLLRAVLFETGDWVSDDKKEDITQVPLRKSSLLLREEAIKRVLDARVHHQKCEDHLGTMNGLLLNELAHAPDAIISPLLKMLDSIRELGEASVHSADARFILFMIKLGMDVLRYTTFAVDHYVQGDAAKTTALELIRQRLVDYAFGFAYETLEKWRIEAESSNNLQTACVIHSYFVLLYVGLRPTELTSDRIAKMIGSIAYVRNWHCFGMRVSAEGSDKSGLSAEERLLRWLQAQGINTENISKSSLDRYLKGRPLYLRIGMHTIQAPNIIALKSMDGNELKLPPSEVLEPEMFEALQSYRRVIVRQLNNLEPASRRHVLGEIIRIALRSTQPDETWEWEEGTDVQHIGRFSCLKTELKLDVQTGEILWRNDELKPVPDSMTQYGDFKSIFGNKSLHCGLVIRQEHRLWIKIIGTDYELIEWDDPPDVVDQGVGAPAPYRPQEEEESKEELKMYWECAACTCANFNGDQPNAVCEVCATPRLAPEIQSPAHASEESTPQESGFVFMNQVFSRQLDIYSEKDHPHPEEEWFVTLVGNVMRLLYPPDSEEKKLQYPLFLPKLPLSASAERVHIIGHDCGNKNKRDNESFDTFKEIVAFRAHKVVHIYALISHGRRMYRKLVFTSDSRLSLHGFPLRWNPEEGAVDPVLLRSGGDPRERQSVGGTLVILRRNRMLGGTEQYVPPRLLQGVVPSCLLEAFRFWLGEDKSIRGEPLDTKSQWFRYRIQVEISENGTATITRRSIRTSFSRILAPGSSSTVIAPRQPAAKARSVIDERGSRAAKVSAPSVRDEDVVQLMAMGFSYAGCVLALRESGGNIAMAGQWLLDDTNQGKIAEAEVNAESGGPISEEEIREQKIGILMSLESLPSRHVVEYAMGVFSDDSELTKAWLEDPNNADEIHRVDEARSQEKNSDSASIPEPMETDEEQKDEEMLEVVEEECGERMKLLSLLDIAIADSDTQQMVELMCRVEDLSHVLVWCTDRSGAISSQVSAELIEVPRLKLKLKQSKCSKSGRVRLDIVDQNGWFISEIPSGGKSATSKYLHHLLSIAPNSWLLESEAGDLRLVCPNHDLHRPQVQGEPLGSLVVANRASAEWQQTMETRFYAYPIHSSRTFFLPPSLSSTFYLILTSLLAKRYEVAMELVVGCNIDVKFTTEEKWVFEQLSRTLDDRHPNACACRVRLSLAIAYSDNKAPWNLTSELHDYVATVAHVDACCKLRLEEECEALTQCRRHSPLLTLRKTYCDARASGDAKSVEFKLTRSRVGGQPWMRLRLYGHQYLSEHGKKLSTVRFSRPKHNAAIENQYLVDDEEAGKLVWNCAIVGDELSGSNRGLGFLFLYECLNRQASLKLGGEECTRSFGDLFTRFLHLKLSRWGRETVEEGEEESTPALALAQLAVMIAHPAEQWPVTPSDPESTRMLSFGANLYSRATFGSLVKSFFEIGEAEFQQKLASNDHQQRVVGPLKEQFTSAHRTAERMLNIEPKLVAVEMEWGPSNSACSLRKFSGTPLGIDPQLPMKAIEVDDFVSYCHPTLIDSSLPFDLGRHPAAQSVAARDLLKRLRDDVAANAVSVNGGKDAFVKGITPQDILDGSIGVATIERVRRLIAECDRIRCDDRKMVDQWIVAIEKDTNAVDLENSGSHHARAAQFIMERRVGQFPKVRFDFLTALLSSSEFQSDLRRRNPFVSFAVDLEDRIVAVLLLCSRIVHLNHTIQVAGTLVALMEQAGGNDTQILQASKDLADAVLTRRHFLKIVSDTWQFDPRFLVFEYVFDILLRARQVQMIDSFMQSLDEGKSRVQQMIMGAGKTTVVGPLLTYILADKQHLVMHVMPTALLEQSRQVLRSRFSNAVLRKRIFTFEFDRSIADDPDHAIKLYEKLNRARSQGDVVCASPESIKSMMLKLIELLHSLEESSEVIQMPPSQVSQSIRRIRRILEDRSDMADELYKTIRIWQDGVLIMDEVDVLLHPLRSELNFPIGNKFPIDLAANRWELPVHLLDAVLADLTDEVGSKGEVVHLLHEVLAEGYASHALQRFPHLVLLDMDFYETRMMPLVTEIALEWLHKHFRMGKMEVTEDVLRHYLQCARQELHSDAALRGAIESGLSDSSIKLLNLARDWIRTILPHVLSKINRVSYGLLRGEYQAAAASGAGGGNSHSRLLLAVPFVGKDVPSRSSEFAHPDVLIGLTILAYRYEGIRVSDLVRVVSQLKQDFSRQLGPRDQRPACAMFREWVAAGLQRDLKQGKSGGGVLPLPLFQLRDESQVARLHDLVSKQAGIVYYYVRQHVFPSCMNFQKLKISACGHELGSNALFAKRIGFSGTPSNLLPLDLGECYYEPRSDGRIFHTLTNPRIVSIERKINWTARGLLLDIAHADPPFHALIDTGALITGFENHEVAAFLLEHLPHSMEGVVYLDTDDRQMILMRDHTAAMPLVQCGLSPVKRFTFYDQVHTTGMDIKQCVNARAVVTLGKDMTFRDYAQGSYRMRGIETGQTIHLFMIPEVENRIRHEMSLAGSVHVDALSRDLQSYLLLVPAWLLVNSMRMESMQLIQLSMQELQNTWRKTALASLMDEIEKAHAGGASTLGSRLRRFIGNSNEAAWLRDCIERFREAISYAIEAAVPTKKEIIDVVNALVQANEAFLHLPDKQQRVNEVRRRLAHSSGVNGGEDAVEQTDMRLTAEVVHENEQEAEEEAEEEAEQEEQKMSAFVRDDEHPIPWSADLLGQVPNVDATEDDSTFYQFAKFQPHADCPKIAFPPHQLVSGNFFRRRWVGLGERRVKNIGLVLEWSPLAEQESMKKTVQHLFMETIAQNPGMVPNEAAVQALLRASTIVHEHPDAVPVALKQGVVGMMDTMPVFEVAVSLAEGETIRRMIHQAHPVFKISQLRLRTCEGQLVESSSLVASWGDAMEAAMPTRSQAMAVGTQCLRFFNNEMYYTPSELDVLLQGLENVPIGLRLEFFDCCLRLRRRERHLWGDTPLAKVFTCRDEWHLLSARARMQQFQQSLKQKRKIRLATALRNFDENGDGRLNAEETLKCLESFQLGFSSGELSEVIAVIADAQQFETQGGVALETICAAFGLSKQQMEEQWRQEDAKLTQADQDALWWQCPVCTFANEGGAAQCGACNQANPSLHEETTSQRGWECPNCTFINLPGDVACAICELGMDGQRAVPRGKWVCAGEQGGCTFFNSTSNFYCEVCNRARPDLAATKF